MRDKIFRKVSKGLNYILAALLCFSINSIPVFAEEINVSIQSGNVQKAAEWDQVPGLIDAASENDIIDITGLQFTKPNITLGISKNIVIKCEPTSKPFAQVVIRNLFFEISNKATLTLENVAIENTHLDRSIISGTGNTVVSKSVLQPDNSNGTTTAYNPPSTIDLKGDVIVKTDADMFSSMVAGATIIDRENNQSGTAGTAIKAENVSVNGGYVVGGSSFASNCNSGDGIVASGNVIVNGVRLSGINSNAKVASGTVSPNATNTIVGMPICFTEDDQKQRVLFVSGGDVFGNNRSSGGTSAPFTIKMSQNDIAIIDSSIIGWYRNIPLFSNGFYCITNPINTWGTLSNSTKVYPVTALNASLSGTRVVTLANIVSHYAPESTQITVTADAPSSGQQFREWVATDNSVSFENSKNAVTTFTMPAKELEVTATYEAYVPPHVHEPSTTWSKDATNHWHECTANDGEKMDLASHTFGDWIIDTPATETTKGSKHRDCTVCGQRETLEIPVLSHTHTPAKAWTKNATNHWHECTANDGEKMDLASHTFGDWIIDTPATKTTKGSKHRDCTVCGQRETLEIPVLSHTHTPSKAWTKNTTNHWHECTANDGEKMDLAAHTFGDWIIDTPATETTKGSKHRDCTVCGQRETIEIPATGVTPEKPIITVGASSTYQINNGKDMILTCSGILEDLTGIYIDGKLVDNSNYTLKSGSTILTLKTSYLDTLSAGKHTLKFQYKDNLSAETNFIIAAKADETPINPSSPQTGDTSSTILNLGLLVFAGSIACFGLMKKNRKKRGSIEV